MEPKWTACSASPTEPASATAKAPASCVQQCCLVARPLRTACPPVPLRPQISAGNVPSNAPSVRMAAERAQASLCLPLRYCALERTRRRHLSPRMEHRPATSPAQAHRLSPWLVPTANPRRWRTAARPFLRRCVSTSWDCRPCVAACRHPPANDTEAPMGHAAVRLTQRPMHAPPSACMRAPSAS